MNLRSPIFRLVALYCLLLLVLGAGFALFTVQRFEDYSRQTIFREIEARSGAIWQTARDRLDDRQALSRLIETRFAPEAQERFIRITQGRNILYQSAAPAGTDTGALKLRETTNASGSARLGTLLLNTRTYDSGGGRRIAVESGQSSAFAEAVEQSLSRTLILGLPVLIVLSALGGYVLMRQALRPIESMIDVAEAITFNNPGTRLPLAKTGDRLEMLGLALNRMLDRLDHAYRYANRFSVDAAHELRTPLAIIRGELESIAELPMSEELAVAHKNMLDEVKRLGELVDNLGMISQMDSVWGKRAHEQVDLHALARETMEQMRLLAEAKEVALSPLTGEPTIVAGDRNRLKQVLVNLIDNAIKYTPAGGTVSVDVKPVGRHAELVVRDTGIGIPSEHRDAVFARFFRVSTDRGETGSGLGLSIVKAICNAHGGNVEVASDAGAGSIFRVELPLGVPSASAG